MATQTEIETSIQTAVLVVQNSSASIDDRLAALLTIFQLRRIV